MKVEKKVFKNEVELIIELEKDEIEIYTKKVLLNIKPNFEIEGFRKGMVPIEIIEKKLGQDVILQKALDDMIPYYYSQAIIQENLEPIGMPKIEILALIPKNLVRFKAIVALFPKFDLPPLKEIKIKVNKIQVETKEIESTLKELQELRAKEEISDTPSKIGDRMIIDFQIFQNGVLVEGGKFEKFSLILGKKQIIPDFEKQLYGLKQNEEKKFNLKFPEDYPNKQFAGKNYEVKVRVKKVLKRILPKIDDSFVQSLNPKFKTLSEYKKELKKNIFKEKKEEQKREIEDKIIKVLLKRTDIKDIPEILIKKEQENIIAEIKDNIVSQGGSFEDYLKHLNKTENQLKSDLRESAKKRVKSALIFKKLADTFSVKVSDEELEEEINNLLLKYPLNPKVLNTVKDKKFQDYLRVQFLNKKILERLKEIVKIEEV